MAASDFLADLPYDVLEAILGYLVEPQDRFNLAITSPAMSMGVREFHSTLKNFTLGLTGMTTYTPVPQFTNQTQIVGPKGAVWKFKRARVRLDFARGPEGGRYVIPFYTTVEFVDDHDTIAIYRLYGGYCHFLPADCTSQWDYLTNRSGNIVEVQLLRRLASGELYAPCKFKQSETDWHFKNIGNSSQ